MKLKVCENNASKIDFNLKKALCKLLHTFVQCGSIFDIKYHFIEIDDFWSDLLAELKQSLSCHLSHW